MSLNNFAPEIWTARVLANLHNQLVFANTGVTVNADYEGIA